MTNFLNSSFCFGFVFFSKITKWLIGWSRLHSYYSLILDYIFSNVKELKVQTGLIFIIKLGVGNCKLFTSTEGTRFINLFKGKWRKVSDMARRYQFILWFQYVELAANSSFQTKARYPFPIHIPFTGISKRLFYFRVYYPKMSNPIFAGNVDKLVKFYKGTRMDTLWVWACAVIQSTILWNGIPCGSHMSWWSGTFLGFVLDIKSMCWENNKRMSLILTVHTSF